MATALETAERHLAELAADRVAPRDKPSAFHHGLLTTLVAELKETNSRIADDRKPQEPGIAAGSVVRYHPVRGQPHDGREYTVTDVGRMDTTPIAWLNEKRGCVAIANLSLVSEER